MNICITATNTIPIIDEIVPISDDAGNLYSNTISINDINTNTTKIAIFTYLFFFDTPNTSSNPPVISRSIFWGKI